MLFRSQRGMQADTKKKMEALSAIGKQAPRLGEGVRIVRQHNKRPTTRAGRAELKGKKVRSSGVYGFDLDGGPGWYRAEIRQNGEPVAISNHIVMT